MELASCETIWKFFLYMSMFIRYGELSIPSCVNSICWTIHSWVFDDDLPGHVRVD